MLLLGDCNHWLTQIKDNSIDLIVTDPPYGIEFMGKDWDKALVSTETWKECYRVLKQGKLAFVMCSPRQDVLARMIIHLQDAGFRTNYTSIYWTYASGFPKAANVSKLIDKRFKKRQEYYDLGSYLKENRERLKLSQKDIAKCFPSITGGLTGCVWNWENAENVPTEEQYKILKDKLRLDNRFDWLIEQETKRYEEAEREIIATKQKARSEGQDFAMPTMGAKTKYIDINITKSATEEAKKMEGAYVGFQPKPAVEVILVVSKGKTLTWLDDCRIPYQSEQDKKLGQSERESLNNPSGKGFIYGKYTPCDRSDRSDIKGRFPANLLVQDDVLNDGKITKSGPVGFNTKGFREYGAKYGYDRIVNPSPHDNKAVFYNDSGSYSRYFSLDQWWSKTFPFLIVPKASKSERGEYNKHPTVKALKLMSYLITMGSREGDLVLDPFCGSGTVCIAADNLHRKWLGIERNPEYAEIIKKRLMVPLSQLKMEIYQ